MHVWMDCIHITTHFSVHERKVGMWNIARYHPELQHTTYMNNQVHRALFRKEGEGKERERKKENCNLNGLEKKISTASTA